MGPVAGGQPGKIRDLVQQVIANQEPELVTAIRAGAQAKVAQIKGQLVECEKQAKGESIARRPRRLQRGIGVSGESSLVNTRGFRCENEGEDDWEKETNCNSRTR